MTSRSIHFLVSLAWRDLRGAKSTLWIFAACIALGVTLVAASGGLHRLVGEGLLHDTRQLMGGDIEVDTPEALPLDAIEWIRARGRMTLVTELYTMLGTASGEFVRVELQTTDEHYPLYGQLRLSEPGRLSDLVAKKQDEWGVVVDRSLAERYGIRSGDRVAIGYLQMQVRALIDEQPDRQLNANWRGAPVLLSSDAVDEARLIQPGSRVDYDYKIAVDGNADEWRESFYQAFPGKNWEARTFEDRSERISKRLGQIASGLLIIAFSTLFIGGLGVQGSIQAYLQGRLRSIACLRALGLRRRRLAAVYLIQVGMLGGGAGLLGCLLGGGLGWTAAGMVAEQLPMEARLESLLAPLVLAWSFGLLTAFLFALPVLGRALAVSPAGLFRDRIADLGALPANWRRATAALAVGLMLLLILAIPDRALGAAFLVVIAGLFVLLEGLVRFLAWLGLFLNRRSTAKNGFVRRYALAGLYRPDSALRQSLWTLGSALTVLVVSALVVISLLRMVHDTIPNEAPSLVLYDINNDQLASVQEAARSIPTPVKLLAAPLVRARITAMNDRLVEHWLDGAGSEFRAALNNNHKLSYRAGNLDGIELVEGQWWPDNSSTPLMSLEDREARRLNMGLGDRLRFLIDGRQHEWTVAAIHRQKGVQTRFWFEGIVNDGSLDPYIHRHVGVAYYDPKYDTDAQRAIAAVAPNVITVPTQRVLATATRLLKQATNGLLVITGISFLASLLVLGSVLAATRHRQIYESTLLSTLGLKRRVIQRCLLVEFLILAVVTASFASLLGSAIALPLLELRLKIPALDLFWLACLTSVMVGVTTLGISAGYLNRRLKMQPAALLREAYR